MNKEELEQAFNETTDNAVKLLKENVELKKEIERLNNIINEIEKILDENLELTYVCNGKRQFNKTLTEGGLLMRDYVKEKLQELKGEDKE